MIRSPHGDYGLSMEDRMNIPCDHKWGEGDNEYSKTRTVATSFDSDVGHFQFDICDRCKTHLYYIDDKLAFTWHSISGQEYV